MSAQGSGPEGPVTGAAGEAAATAEPTAAGEAAAVSTATPAAAAATDGTAADGARRAARGRHAALWIGAVLTGLVLLLAAVSVVWTPFDPVAADASQRLLGPGGEHALGTDKFGRDVLSQIMAGSRVTLLVGLVAVGIALVIGTPLGILAAMRGGWVQEVILRFSDLLLAFPALLLAIVFAAVFGAGTVSAMVAIGLGSVPGFARVARAATLSVLEREFITAARASGRGPWGVAVLHVVPNLLGLLLVQCTVTFSLAVLAEAALSYLGLGTPPPDPSWGRMLHEAQPFLAAQPLLTVWPGLAIALTVLGLNLLGDGLRDKLSAGRDGR